MMHGQNWDSLHNALNHHPIPKAKPFNFWSISKCQEILVRSIFSIGRPHNDSHINASNVSSFNQILQSLNPRSHIAMFAESNSHIKVRSPTSHHFFLVGFKELPMEFSFTWVNYRFPIMPCTPTLLLVSQSSNLTFSIFRSPPPQGLSQLWM